MGVSSATLQGLLVALFETLYLVLIPGIIAVVLGFAWGVGLFFSQSPSSGGRVVHGILSTAANAVRAVPFIILSVVLIPVTRYVVGTSVGSTAALVPLSVAGIPYFARLTEAALLALPPALMEAGISMGARAHQILYHMLWPEAMPQLIRGATLLIISLTEYSAIAGALGGGGLGDFAIHYGYYQFDGTTLCLTVGVIMVWIQGIQWAGNAWFARCNRR